MEKETIKTDIKEIISKIARIDQQSITDITSFRDDLWIDSLQAIQIIARLEDLYGIKIDEVEIFNVDTVDEVVEMLEEYGVNK